MRLMFIKPIHYLVMLSLLLSTALIFSSVTSVTAASIAIANPGFESDATGWTKVGSAAISTSDSHSGSRSAKSTDTGGGYKQTISGLTANTSYTLKAWILGSGVIGVNSYGGNEVTAGGSTSAWTQFTVNFTTGASNTSAVIFARGTTSSDARFDDFTLDSSSGSTPTPTPTTTPAPTSTPPNAPTLPSQVLYLKNWKITLPIPKQSGSTSPLEVLQPALDTYSIDPWFKVVHDADGYAVQFRANHGAVTTSGSNNPRSELREMKDLYTSGDSSSQMAWGSNDGKTHTMYIKQKVTHLTTVKPHTVVGQIHDGDDDVTVFRVEGNNPGGVSTTAKIYITDGNNSHGYLLDSNYTLGTLFTVKIIVANGVISYEYNGQPVPYTQTKDVTGCFFKIGNYTQSNDSTAPGESPDAYAENWVYEYSVTHQ
ncbi:polysaccharide lyase family 7 protein [Bacillus sp. 3255]|uniref:polysaccharide lyase family 7 protein n=1 Tax=Bacillus sp. 3255 TaxID=2817904 RepID=UPI0028574688|nr:polysaccharide lyase family 7 protein [Bacillus sp. 3255]MDR6882007.1 hypothetical protein [Bacillus sp. 3255]